MTLEHLIKLALPCGHSVVVPIRSAYGKTIHTKENRLTIKGRHSAALQYRSTKGTFKTVEVKI